MKILFLTDNFYPEMNAPANRTYEHCREWVKMGMDVTVITCVPNFPAGKVFPGYKNKLYQKEFIDGIKVIRVWSYITANTGTFKRIVDYISFAFMAFIVSIFIRTEIIIATSPQFFTAIAGRLSSFFKRKPWVMEVRDIWPESIVAVGAMKKSKAISLLEIIEKHLYKSAAKIVVVTDSFKENIIQKGIDPKKIYVIKNGVYIDKFKPIPKNLSVIEKLNLREKFVLAYFGTHGMAHRLDFILNCAKNIQDPEIHILFIGDGAERENLIKLKEELSLTNVTMLYSVPKNEIQNFISIIDVALVTLKKSDTFKSVIPSKIFENAAMHKPIFLGVEGESKELVENYKVGLCFEPENEKDFLGKLNEIKMNTLNKIYIDGCVRMTKDFNRINLAHKMIEAIK
ncbi:MAG TPA: glycosyltransferase family 4 protein [Saprospiraceae bacterium]|nr:glycosyltransferase family 4 protein [Saprospiraceae bacterium]